MLEPGVRLGAYEIVSLIGAGGMGEVYRARDTRLDRIVAVKVLPPGSTELKVRFDREARAISSLDHPNVCALYDVGHESGIDYLVMQYLEGETLAARIERGPLPLAEVARVAGQIAAALQAAHRRGIVHRDLKPANVFLVSNAGDEAVKLLDFGLASWRTPVAGSQADTTSAGLTTHSTVTELGRPIGTLPYMAPEQVEGRAIDTRADVWAFGAVLYEMITGQRAFRGATRLGVAGAILHDDPTPMSTLRRGVPSDVDRLVKKCLAKQPAARFASATELITEFHRIEPTLGGEAVRWRPSRVIGVALAATTAAALVGAVIYLRSDHVAPVGQTAVAADTTVLALLPFDVSADPSRKAYWDGLADAVTTKLSALPASYHLTVLPQSEVRRNNVRDAASAHRELGATKALLTTVLSTPPSATFQLTDTTSGRVLGVRTVSLDSSTGTQSPDARVLEAIVALVDLKLVARDRAALLAGEGGPGAYDFYLQALGYLQDYDRPENIDTAIGMFRHALEVDANNALAYAGLGRAYWIKYGVSKDPSLLETARQACERALGIDEREAAPHACLGDVDSGTGQYEKSLEEFQHALEREPDSDYGLLGLATAYERLNRVQDAEDTYKRAIAARPRYWAGYMRLGAFYHNTGHDADAERVFRQVISILPDSWRGYSNLGAVLYTQGKSDEAIAAFEKSWSLRPNYQAASNLGTLYYFEKRDYQRAAAAYKRALSQDDRQFVVWGNYAAALRWAGDAAGATAAYTKAIALAEEARTTNPRNARTLMSLSGYYGSVHTTDRARELMEQALALDSENAAILYQAAELCETELHDRDRAFSLLEKALNRGYQWTELERSPSLATLRKDPRFAELRSRHANANKRGV